MPMQWSVRPLIALVHLFPMLSIGRELLIAALATAVGAQGVVYSSVAAVCPAGLSNTAFVRGLSCYEFNGEEKTWTKARDFCHERGGRLVSITDVELQAWLSSSAARLWPKQKGVWIGLNDRATGGVFVWDDYGTNAEHRLTYSNWASGFPTNTALSGDCVHMRSDEDWKWSQKPCDAILFFFYTFICEYRVTMLNVTATSVGLPVMTSVAGVTLSVATDFPLAVLTSSAINNSTYNAGATAGKTDVTLPLSISVAVVIVVALVALAVVIWRRRQRYRPPNGSNVLWSRTDGDEGFMIGNPMYGDSPQLAMDQTSVTPRSGGDGVSGRPVSNIYAEMSSAVPVINNQNDVAVDLWLSNRDTEPTYAEPLMQEPSAAITTESATPYHQYTYIDTATLQKVQQPETSAGRAASTDKKPGMVLADTDQHSQQLNSSRSTQDGYEPFVSQWTPYENVQKPDA